MGNADLRDIAVLETVERASFDGSVVAVDAANWLYKYLTTTTQFTATEAYTTESGDEVPNLIGAVRGLPKFFEHDLTPLFVFDGAPHALKSDELERRRETRDEAQEAAEEALERGDVVEAAKLSARAQGLTDVIIETTKSLFDHLDVAYVTAPGAGEALAATMAAENDDIDAVISEDYDAMLYGSPVTIRGFTSSSDDLEQLSLEATLLEHDLTHRQLVEIALLCGTDYNDGVRGVGPKTALSEIQETGDLETVLSENDWEIPNRDAILELFLNPVDEDEYTVPDISTPQPDIERAREFVVDEWGIPEDSVETAFEKLTESSEQTGLGSWS